MQRNIVCNFGARLIGGYQYPDLRGQIRGGVVQVAGYSLALNPGYLPQNNVFREEGADFLDLVLNGTFTTFCS